MFYGKQAYQVISSKQINCFKKKFRLKMIGSLQDLGVVEEDKIKILLNQYLSKNQSKLGIDFVSTLNLTDVED